MRPYRPDVAEKDPIRKEPDNDEPEAVLPPTGEVVKNAPEKDEGESPFPAETKKEEPVIALAPAAESEPATRASP